MLNLSLYKENYMHPKGDAQSNLAGRTHYVDDGSMRFFKARINYAAPKHGGLLYAIVESFQYDDGERKHRGVVFDITGGIVYHPTIDDCFKTSKAARLAMDLFLESFDSLNHTHEALDNELELCRDSIEYARGWATESSRHA